MCFLLEKGRLGNPGGGYQSGFLEECMDFTKALLHEKNINFSVDPFVGQSASLDLYQIINIYSNNM